MFLCGKKVCCCCRLGVQIYKYNAADTVNHIPEISTETMQTTSFSCTFEVLSHQIVRIRRLRHGCFSYGMVEMLYLSSPVRTQLPYPTCTQRPHFVPAVPDLYPAYPIRARRKHFVYAPSKCCKALILLHFLAFWHKDQRPFPNPWVPASAPLLCD